MSPDRNYPPYSTEFYKEIQKEIDIMKPEVKICPCCGQPIPIRNDAEKYFSRDKKENQEVFE